MWTRLKRTVSGGEAAAASAVAAAVWLAAASGGFGIPAGWDGGPIFAIALLSLPVAVSAAVAAVAWRSGEWAPSLLAAGCIAMAAAPLSMASDRLAGPGPADMATFPIAMAVGAVLYTLSVVPFESTRGLRRRAPRSILVAACLATGSWVFVRRLAFDEVPDVTGLRAILGLGAGLYVLSGLRFTTVYRLGRLRLQLLVAIASFGFAGVLLARELFPGQPLVVYAALAFASLPAAGLVGEERARPGLRSAVFALFLPGALAALRNNYPQPMRRLLSLIADDDPGLVGHLDRVADLAARLAEQVGLGPSAIRQAHTAGQLHDIGKLYIPRELLDKPGALTEAERRVMETHAAEGARLAARLGFTADLCTVIGQHHERWDGAGYPSRIPGPNLHPVAPVVTLADTYDALVSDRAYKRGWSSEEALNEIAQQSGTKFDPAVSAALQRMFRAPATIPLMSRAKEQRAA